MELIKLEDGSYDFPAKYPITADKHVGTKYVVITPDKVVAEITCRPDITQPAGVLHGGVNAFITESVASIAANQYMLTTEGYNGFSDSPYFMVGMEVNCNHVSSLQVGETAVATALPAHRGYQSHVWTVEIRRKHNDSLVAVGRMTAHRTRNPEFKGPKKTAPAKPKL